MVYIYIPHSKQWSNKWKYTAEFLNILYSNVVMNTRVCVWIKSILYAANSYREGPYIHERVPVFTVNMGTPGPYIKRNMGTGNSLCRPRWRWLALLGNHVQRGELIVRESASGTKQGMYIRKSEIYSTTFLFPYFGVPIFTWHRYISILCPCSRCLTQSSHLRTNFVPLWIYICTLKPVGSPVNRTGRPSVLQSIIINSFILYRFFLFCQLFIIIACWKIRKNKQTNKTVSVVTQGARAHVIFENVTKSSK